MPVLKGALWTWGSNKPGQDHLFHQEISRADVSKQEWQFTLAQRLTLCLCQVQANKLNMQLLLITITSTLTHSTMSLTLLSQWSSSFLCDPVCTHYFNAKHFLCIRLWDFCHSKVSFQSKLAARRAGGDKFSRCHENMKLQDLILAGDKRSDRAASLIWALRVYSLCNNLQPGVEQTRTQEKWTVTMTTHENLFNTFKNIFIILLRLYVCLFFL